MRKESLVAQPQPQPPQHHPQHQHPHQKSGKPLHPADLPDLLGDSRDVPMASADDLLSEMVDNDVERLMSGEFDPIVPGHKAVERLQHQIGKFLDEVRQREQTAAAPAAPRVAEAPKAAAPPKPPAAPRVPIAPRTPAPIEKPRVYEDEAGPSLDDLVGPTHEQLIGLHSGEFEPTAARGPAESRALLAPVDVAANESALLKPLDWMSAPVAAMSGRSRVLVSMLAVTSFLAGCAALGYVLMLRHGGV